VALDGTMKPELKIGEMAALLGTTTKTLRHYESLHLLAPPTRTATGYRVGGEFVV
jgi:DNA-binding transcriptional MerR regulator